MNSILRNKCRRFFIPIFLYFYLALILQTCVYRSSSFETILDAEDAGSSGLKTVEKRVRGAWLDWTSLRVFEKDLGKGRKHLDSLMIKVRSAKLNTLYVISWRYGCAKFNKIAHASTDTDFPVCNSKIDYLQEVIDATKRAGLTVEIVPWLERPIGVGTHEEIYKATFNWYTKNGLLEDSNVVYKESGFSFPMMALNETKVRNVMRTLIKSLFLNYGAKKILVDDHLRLPKEQATNLKLQEKLLEFGNFLFSTIRGFKKDVVIEYAPLVLHYSVSEYGTDWTKWSSKFDKVLMQCYSRTPEEATDSGDCYKIPPELESKFMGIGIYTRMHGIELNDEDIAGFVKKQTEKKQSFVIFTLEMLRSSAARTIGNIF